LRRQAQNHGDLAALKFMPRFRCTRREFARSAGGVSAAALLRPGSTIFADRLEKKPMSTTWHLATNQYPWLTFYRRENRNFNEALDQGLAEIARSGLQGYEPLVEKPQDVETLAPLLAKHGLEMRSLYVNTTLHLPEQAEKSIAQVLAIAQAAKTAGTRIIVTNPIPIAWGSTQAKDDAQLRFQAAALEKLGRALADLGLVLAYHNHDAELRHAAREFHHMMLGTAPKFVTLCLDAHWIYCGAGNSLVALMDILKLYGPRATELHLRQSERGIWTESFGPGDIDYAAVAAYFGKLGTRPHLVLEQAVEKDTPKTLDIVEAHRRGVLYARKVFADWEKQ
jgi:inosose dehydratase